MRVLVTRPNDDAARIADALQAMGQEAVVVPLQEVRLRDGPELALAGVQAVLATSANGVRAFAKRSARRDVALFGVGPQTAQAARAAGFASVRDADGDAAKLADAVALWTSPRKGALLHVKGSDAPDTLAELLTAKGFKVRGDVLYDIAPLRARSALGKAFASGVDAALFFSPRSAAIFRENAADFDLSRVAALCISDATAAALAPLHFRELRVASRPNQRALLALIGT